MQNALIELLPAACDEGASTSVGVLEVPEAGGDVGAPLPLIGVDAAMSRLIEMALATCASPQTRRVYGSRLATFIASGFPLNREGVALHIQRERDKGVSGSTLQGALAAIRKLVAEAEVRGLMSAADAAQIKGISAGKQHKTRAGLWLTVPQVRRLLDLPDRSSYWGKRDACLLSVLVGCGLRRAEMASLKWSHYQNREGRMCLVDVLGKGNKLRTVPVPTWANADVKAWHVASKEPEPNETGSGNGNRPREMRYVVAGMGADSMYERVQMYGARMGLPGLTPHDLRRTLAQMMRKSGAPLEQIQATLGHTSIETTATYLGSCLELGEGKASVDKIALQREEDDDE